MGQVVAMNRSGYSPTFLRRFSIRIQVDFYGIWTVDIPYIKKISYTYNQGYSSRLFFEDPDPIKNPESGSANLHKNK